MGGGEIKAGIGGGGGGIQKKKYVKKSNQEFSRTPDSAFFELVLVEVPKADDEGLVEHAAQTRVFDLRSMSLTERFHVDNGIGGPLSHSDQRSHCDDYSTESLRFATGIIMLPRRCNHFDSPTELQ